MMNSEVRSIINNLQNVLDGNPWFGRPVYAILNEIHPVMAYTKPGGNSHSLIELLYHIITWAEFTVKRLQKDVESDMDDFEQMDWRLIDPHIHTWANALEQFKTAHDRIFELLRDKDDAFLKEKVDYREYNFRFLLNGLIQHDIYHLAQIAYVKKLLS
ncbi:MAG: DinB family protein [Chitinophagaceae bacterium]|nr:DinB family protein [Chitinophagaceae bacterium]